LLDDGYSGLPVGNDHAVEINVLLLLHKDSLSCVLIAQMWVEKFRLLTPDTTVARYPSPIPVG
jgi:PIN domain nuclease of toxin-antitoxin system